MIFNQVVKKNVLDLPKLSKDINFYDYDGTLVYSYTFPEITELKEFPSGPSHSGLIFQGWNWTLEKIKALTRPMNVGAMYITDDGKTRLKIYISDKARGNITLYINQTVANGVTIDWGDKSTTETLDGTGNISISHQYGTEGDYIIVLSVADGCELGFGNTNLSYCIFGSTNNTNLVYNNILKEINIGNGVSSIDRRSFMTCHSLKSVTIPSSVIEIDNNGFRDCHSLKSVVIPDGVTSIGEYSFGNDYSLSNITIPDSVTSIGNGAFYGCSPLSNITIPDSVTSIGDSVFRGCYALNNIIIPRNVTSIKNYMFYVCQSLSNITIPDSVTSIGANSIQECYSLVNIIIPDSVTSIGANAFSSCYGIAEYHFKSINPPTLANANVFTNISSDCIIYVPAGSLESYQAAENWSTYASHMQEEPV